jgi:prepilin-type N-terminal cleavage/methylation domain-containing protein
MLRTKKSGMTLIEIMVSVLIVAILAAGLFAVSGYIDKQFKIKSTESTIHLLVAALDQYHDFYKAFPDPNVSAYPADVNGSIEKLYFKLTFAPDAKKILDQINRKYVKKVDKDDYPEIVDAWNTRLKYSYIEKQNWNFPVITSAGPNKIFEADDPNSVPDDISSKKM